MMRLTTIKAGPQTKQTAQYDKQHNIRIEKTDKKEGGTPFFGLRTIWKKLKEKKNNVKGSPTVVETK